MRDLGLVFELYLVALAVDLDLGNVVLVDITNGNCVLVAIDFIFVFFHFEVKSVNFF